MGHSTKSHLTCTKRNVFCTWTSWKLKHPWKIWNFIVDQRFWLLSEGHQWSHKKPFRFTKTVRLSGSGGIGPLFCKEVPWQIIPTNQYILRSQTFKKSRKKDLSRNEQVINFDLIFPIYIYIPISYIDEPWWTNHFGNPMGRYDSKAPKSP